MADSVELKPCPFCGSNNVDPEGWASRNPVTGESRTGPCCDDCGASGDSIEAWNRRVSASPLEGGEKGLGPASGSGQAEPGLPAANHDALPAWRPIKSHDGCTPALVIHRAPKHWYGPTTAFVDVTGVWRVACSPGGNAELMFEPTHWMPLPQPPTPTSQEAGHAE